MAKMNSEIRKKIVDICREQGFEVVLKADGTDEYQKNLLFKTGNFKSKLFIHRDTGINSSGNMSYLKVAVHPAYFKPEAIDSSHGIEDFINARSKINRHSSSNYIGFPIYNGYDEPCGKCYKVTSFGGLEQLLSNLVSL